MRDKTFQETKEIECLEVVVKAREEDISLIGEWLPVCPSLGLLDSGKLGIKHDRAIEHLDRLPIRFYIERQPKKTPYIEARLSEERWYSETYPLPKFTFTPKDCSIVRYRIDKQELADYVSKEREETAFHRRAYGCDALVQLSTGEKYLVEIHLEEQK